MFTKPSFAHRIAVKNYRRPKVYRFWLAVDFFIMHPGAWMRMQANKFFIRRCERCQEWRLKSSLKWFGEDGTMECPSCYEKSMQELNEWLYGPLDQLGED